ncbi:dethiobiotin synthase [Candidatus Methylospira mobilis]|uniref:ATP-dependent dethiobiotin synthetase BioD n=1 Tax=Candidatus Methylospira mobilis TaxID=1808979 RepID=A0A5Q0BJZ1_9GAMM|nr:dethiobiotin synthase [Candidatus Methylospira mobilis]QFY42504.1 dethiobiotin synthase [Candidatus Methylospira mobilis]WNV04388.1 dethiobiotin synthase [Candidatus Methylospira mobilis]
MAGFFITGTDTGVGKTWVALALMHALQTQGLHVLGMKPVATGCDWIDGELRNEDALLLQRQASRILPYSQVNPYAYQLPVAPDIAAKRENFPVNIDHIVAQCRVLEASADSVLVEGVGGWTVPLGESVKVADMALCLKLPVILVVGLRLGCINHALLTWDAMVRSGVTVAGWVASECERSFEFSDETLVTLQREMNIACITRVFAISRNDLLSQINFNADAMAKILPRMWG